jgi:hypothetical protein
MMNMVSPGLLGTPKQFSKIFSEVIVKSRDKRGSDHDQRLGRKKLRELSRLTQPLMLRRHTHSRARAHTHTHTHIHTLMLRRTMADKSLSMEKQGLVQLTTTTLNPKPGPWPTSSSARRCPPRWKASSSASLRLSSRIYTRLCS